MRVSPINILTIFFPREIEPHHPRLPLGFKRHFKCYVNLHMTYKKIEWLCQNNIFIIMGEGIKGRGLED